MTRPTPFELVVRAKTLRGLAWGSPDAPTTLALHGWLDNAATFTHLAPLVAAAGHRVLALDLPGHGRSDHRSPDASYHYVNYAIDVVEAVAELELEELSLLGHSMGAGVSLIAAAGLGERVRRIDLVEGLGPFTTPAAESAETFAKAARSSARVRSRDRGVYPDLDGAVARKRDALGSISVDSARLLVERSLRKVEGGWQFGDDPRLSGRSWIRFTEEQFHDFLEAVTAPVHLVTASDGLSYPEEAFRGRIARLSDITHRELEGGHHLHLDAAESVARALGYLE